MLNEDVLNIIRRELKKIAAGINVDIKEFEQIVKTEVNKREVLESDEGIAAKIKLNKLFKKSNIKTKNQPLLN